MKHLLDHSSSLLTASAAPVAERLIGVQNRSTATEMRVDLLTTRVEKLETESSKSKAVFAEEQDGRANIEFVFCITFGLFIPCFVHLCLLRLILFWCCCLE